MGNSRDYKILSSSSLHIIAMISMLIDHTYHYIGNGQVWMNCIGRIAFPIFCFLLVEGYYHTSNYIKYALRLFIFGIISEIPFDLMVADSIYYIGHQNVMFELLIGLVSIYLVDNLIQSNNLDIHLIIGVIELGILIFLADMLNLDYGSKGIILIIIFALSRNLKSGWLIQLIGLYLICIAYNTYKVTLWNGIIKVQIQIQLIAMLALPLIWMYNGRKGIDSKVFKYINYSFYPLHLTLLYIIFTIINEYQMIQVIPL